MADTARAAADHQQRHPGAGRSRSALIQSTVGGGGEISSAESWERHAIAAVAAAGRRETIEGTGSVGCVPIGRDCCVPCSLTCVRSRGVRGGKGMADGRSTVFGFIRFRLSVGVCVCVCGSCLCAYVRRLCNEWVVKLDGEHKCGCGVVLIIVIVIWDYVKLCTSNCCVCFVFLHHNSNVCKPFSINSS